ncbi:MAG: YabP/YqfC family sporulation protein, partial [Clostridia bacterium]|nr:YabP/YqfC family sporulation protein [Clostridia bacterium]
MEKKLTVNGVINVLEFTDSFMILKTNLGLVSIEGAELKIESLTKEDGAI